MLMIPGPCDVDADILQESSRPILPHYGEEFLSLYRETGAALAELFGTTGDVLLVPGPGTSGSEFCLCGFAGHRVLVVDAGTFGLRLAEILSAHRATPVMLQVPEREVLDPEDVRRLLESEPDIAAVAMVHSETSNGMLHPLAEVGRLARERDLLFVVDAVSSLGATVLRMDEWGIDMAWSASQKALAAPPGTAAVAMGERAWRFLEGNRHGIAGFLLNPLVWRWHMDHMSWHPYPTSLPTPTIRSLAVAARRMVEEGEETRTARHERAARTIRAAAKALRFEPYPRDERFASPTITALLPPPGLDEERFRASMQADHGVMIAGGFGKLRGRVVRLGHMGMGTSEAQVLATVRAMEGTARTMGLDLDRGEVVDAATRAWKELP